MGWSDDMEEDVKEIKMALSYLLHLQMVGKYVQGCFDVGGLYRPMEVAGHIIKVDDKVTVKLDKPATKETRWASRTDETVEVVEISIADVIYNLTEQEHIDGR